MPQVNICPYGDLVLGASASCDVPASLSEPKGRVAWLTIDDAASVADEAASCHGGSSAHAIGVAALADLVDGFAR